MTTVQPYRNLSVLLWTLSVVEALAGLLMIFATSWILSLAPASLALPDSGFVAIFLKALGILALGLGYLICVAARDPVKHVAIVDTLIFLLVASALLLAFAMAAMNLGKYFPANYMLVRIVVQALLAVILLWLRPRVAAGS